jgi:hypothetical protein
VGVSLVDKLYLQENYINYIASMRGGYNVEEYTIRLAKDINSDKYDGGI